MKDSFLDQAEIDALLRMAGGGPDDPLTEDESDGGEPWTGEPETGATVSALTSDEKDALGEVGNIAMGAAATTLSTLLSRKVSITSPVVQMKTRAELPAVFTAPCLALKVQYTDGLKAGTLLVIKERDAAVIADLMMDNDGSSPAQELDELGISAASEAMNQMVGASATSLANLVGRPITISPPTAYLVAEGSMPDTIFEEFKEPVVTVSFEMRIGTLVDTEIMQVMTVETARNEAALLWGALGEDETGAGTASGDAIPAKPAPEVQPPQTETPVTPDQAAPDTVRAPTPTPTPIPTPIPETTVDGQKLDLILDIPLKVTVILGRTRRPIQEVLGLAPGAIVELAALADEPVEILVNGVMVAKGEVVVVNENFGVRITSISSPRERMRQLYGSGS